MKKPVRGRVRILNLWVFKFNFLKEWYILFLSSFSFSLKSCVYFGYVSFLPYTFLVLSSLLGAVQMMYGGIFKKKIITLTTIFKHTFIYYLNISLYIGNFPLLFFFKKKRFMFSLTHIYHLMIEHKTFFFLNLKSKH